MNQNLKEILGLILRCGIREAIVKKKPKKQIQEDASASQKPCRKSDISR